MALALGCLLGKVFGGFGRFWRVFGGFAGFWRVWRVWRVLEGLERLRAGKRQNNFPNRHPRAKATAMAFYRLSKLPFALQTLQTPSPAGTPGPRPLPEQAPQGQGHSNGFLWAFKAKGKGLQGLEGFDGLNGLNCAATKGFIQFRTCSGPTGQVPHLRWSQASPRPWRRPGSADIYTRIHTSLVHQYILYHVNMYMY